MNAPSRILLTIAVLASALVAGGCSRGMADLDAYIAEVKARPGGRIEPLPEISIYETFRYDPGDARSPFVPDVPAAGGMVGGVRPDADRRREYLESFPLDTLSMVGTISMGGRLYGLVQTTDNLVHRVVTGNYLGQNDGRIVSINSSEIQLLEIIPDGLGGYIERAASISMGEL
jgi:type IV pilus assembly protein PilP